MVGDEKSVSDIKTEMAITAGRDAAEVLTVVAGNDMLSKTEDTDIPLASDSTVNAMNDTVSALCVDGDGGCSSNDMSSAINVPFFSWQSGCISCPGKEIWYKFTTNVGEAHPNRSKGWYGIQTQGSLDTIAYLYDSYGNQIDYDDDGGNNLNFKIIHQLAYGETYYVKVRAFGSNTGSFSFKVDYGRDEHGNSMDTATEIVGVYYQDKSVNGYLHSYGDVDYYTFVPARNCVMEIYTEGDTDTYGQLYCASGGLLASDNNSNGNGNFKITAHLEAMKRYYIAVSHNSATGYGDYTLRFKFVKDYKLNIANKSVSWVNDNPNISDSLGSKVYSIIYLNEDAGYKYHYEMTKLSVRNEINALFNSAQEAVLTDLLCTLIGVSESFVLSTGLGLIVQMINNFSGLSNQFSFENELDKVILNKYGFVRCYNGSYISAPLDGLRETHVTAFDYYNDTCFYGERYYRGRFSD